MSRACGCYADASTDCPGTEADQDYAIAWVVSTCHAVKLEGSSLGRPRMSGRSVENTTLRQVLSAHATSFLQLDSQEVLQAFAWVTPLGTSNTASTERQTECWA